MRKKCIKCNLHSAKCRLEYGYTLAEISATLAVLGVLLSIAALILLGLLEQRRVDAATDQLVSDMRLAHTKATAELTDWRVVVILDRGGEPEGPDYYLVRLKRSYGGETPPEATTTTPKFFPGDVHAKNVRTPGGYLVDDHAAGYWLPPEDALDEGTRTIEFNSDGTATFFESPSGSACVTADGRPQNRIVVTAATSRLRVEPSSGCDTSGAGG